MATKTLDKYTKAELLVHIDQLQNQVTQLASLNAQLLGDKARLRDDLERLESRRNYERVAYQSKLREQQVVSPRRAAMEKAKHEAMTTGRCVAVQL